MTAPANAPAYDRARVQRRTIAVTMGSVIPTTAAMGSSFAASAVLAEDITGSATLATLAAGSLSIGSVIAAVPLSRRMARLGRRRGLVAGWSLGAAGSAAVLLAAVFRLYPLVVLGIIGVGMGQATNLAARYAVADLAADDRRARAIGILVWASTFGAASGPTVGLRLFADLAAAIGLPELAGPYLLSTAMFLAGMAFTHVGLRPDPLEVLGTVGSEAPRPASPVTVIRRISGAARGPARPAVHAGRADGDGDRDDGHAAAHDRRRPGPVGHRRRDLASHHRDVRLLAGRRMAGSTGWAPTR